MKNLKNLDLSCLDTSEVRNLSGAFEGCTHIKRLDFSNNDFSNVVNLWSAFEGNANCEEILLPSTPFGSKLLYGMGIFCGCTSLRELNLVNLDVRNLTECRLMLADNPNLERIYVSKDLFVLNYQDMIDTYRTEVFRGDVALVGEYGTTYQADNVGPEYAVIDGGPNSSAPGYLSQGFSLASDNLEAQDMESSYSYAGSPVEPKPALSVWVDKVLSQNSLSTNSSNRGTDALYETEHVLMPMEQDSDYSLAYFNNNAPGQAIMRVTGEGRFASSADLSFDIVEDSADTLPVTGDMKSLSIFGFLGLGAALLGAYRVLKRD